MKKTLPITGIILLTLGLTACVPNSSELREGSKEPATQQNDQDGTVAPNNNPSQGDNRAGGSVSLPDRTNEEASASEPVAMHVPSELNVIVGPSDTRLEYIDKPAWAPHTLANGRFVRPNGNRYDALIFQRNGRESLPEWFERVSFGNAWISEETVQTDNGKTAFLYKTDDNGALPDIHAFIVGDEYIYRLNWEVPNLPHQPEEALIYIRENDLSFEIPPDFTTFIESISVK
ncbi:hypothetical protein CO046_03870 [Candidatus Peregrinibacteria bacterium CG_4_9_14_0_2_um_filter_53_11]|nr:MAG: hypothetical protein CO046_03870 [Candidatus Peregrinibacteria bacterium CG_4_9_14_0_2_um_filter_53_11]